MRAMPASEGRVRSFGRAGYIPTPAERLERLREAVEIARHSYAVHPCDSCEIRLAKAELLLDEFLARYPELAS